MAIRLRILGDLTVALCAAETDARPGDIYLDDACHRALSTKFGLDWQSMGFIADPPIDQEISALMATQKMRDAEQELDKWLQENCMAAQ